MATTPKTAQAPEGALLQYPGLSPESADAIRRLKEQVAQGKDWGIALLEAAGMWNQAIEELDGRIYVYLVGDEAFDWLLLAERAMLGAGGNDSLRGPGRPALPR